MSSSKDDERVVSELSELFFGTRSDGSPAFTEEAVLNFLPLVFMRAARSPAAPPMPKAVERFLADFAAKLGVEPKMPADEVQKRMAAHYAKHPVNPARASAFERVLREQTALHGADGASKRLAEFLGEHVTTEGYRPGAPKPEGSLRAGPLARFQAPASLGKGPKNRDD